MSEQVKTKYAETLNALCAMQVAPNYAARRSVLIAAEEAIVSLERDLADARNNALEEAAKECDEQAKFYMETGNLSTNLESRARNYARARAVGAVAFEIRGKKIDAAKEK